MAGPAADNFINSIVGEGTAFKGELDVKGLLRVDGDFSGSVRSPSRVLIGSSGRARCTIHATEVVVGGSLKGDIFATDKVTILATGMVIGNIYAPKIVVEEGVLLEGYCCITPRIKEEGAQPLKPQGVFTLKLNRPSVPAEPAIPAGPG